MKKRYLVEWETGHHIENSFQRHFLHVMAENPTQAENQFLFSQTYLKDPTSRIVAIYNPPTHKLLGVGVAS